MTVIKVLDLSTGHLEKSDTALLDTAASVGLRAVKDEPLTDEEEWFDNLAPIVADRGYGYFVWAPADDAEEHYEWYRQLGLSESFIACLKRATELDCHYILFDADADHEDGLPVNEW